MLPSRSPRLPSTGTHDVHCRARQRHDKPLPARVRQELADGPGKRLRAFAWDDLDISTEKSVKLEAARLPELGAMIQ